MLDRGSCVYLHPHPFLLILAFFIWGYKPLFIFTQFFFNLFDPFVIDQMWLLFTRAKNACIALYYTYSCANYRQLQSRSATTAHLATIIFIIHCIWARDIVARAVGQNFFSFFGKSNINSYSAWKQNKILPRDLKPLFACMFWNPSFSLPLPKLAPSFWFTSKVWPLPL